MNIVKQHIIELLEKGCREDGRKFDEMRKIEAEVGVVKRAVGSARFKMGNTEAIAAVYGPKDIPRFLQDAETGGLRCNYNLMSFSTPERVRPGPVRRSMKIQRLLENLNFKGTM